jgi:deoxyribodipyrimidine photo-lyase
MQNDPRVRKLNNKRTVDADYVLYWMQQSQRAEENHALEYAVRKANALRLPVVVAFGLTGGYPEANLRHYTFMVQGLREICRGLAKRKILFVARHGEPPDIALRLGRRASSIVCDRGYLHHQRAWRDQVAREAGCLVEQVEGDVIVPVEAASEKRESSARSFRPKVLRLHRLFLDALPQAVPAVASDSLPLERLDLDNDEAVWGPLSVDASVGAVPMFAGGTQAAKDRLARFLRSRLAGYAENRSQPHLDHVSRMSPYLHFGQISPAYIARRIYRSHNGERADRESFLEEFIVRRELSFNFVHYADDYDRFSCLPDWAQATLRKHRSDRRPYLYSAALLEAAETHDPYWNAAMNEMKRTGYMHNHMRMYWGKQILAWSRTPEMAFETALALNNKYLLDGRDPNSYSNIAWIFGLFDRPWPEREIYGIVRSMTSGGLERKTDIGAYVEKIARLSRNL